MLNVAMMKIQIIALIVLTCLFAAPLKADDKPIWDANLVELQSKELAPNVYAVFEKGTDVTGPQGKAIATSSGFIVGERGILIVDTMLTPRLYKQLITLVQEKSRKPILFAVNTGNHGDHSFGNAWLPEGTRIIQHRATQQKHLNGLEEEISNSVAILGKGRGIEEAKPRPGDLIIEEGQQLTVNLGDKEVTIKDFSEGVAGGELYVWLQKENIIWTGNSVGAEAPALPWLLDDDHKTRLKTMINLHKHVGKNVTIVPGHGRPTDIGAVIFAESYLKDTVAQVRAGIQKGQSLKQIQESVKASKFKGYELFEFAHFKINLPSIYNTLKGIPHKSSVQ